MNASQFIEEPPTPLPRPAASRTLQSVASRLARSGQMRLSREEQLRSGPESRTSAMPLQHSCLLAVAILLFATPDMAYSVLEEEKGPTFLTASVGQHVVLNCHLDFPYDIVIPYILSWNKEGEEVLSYNGGKLTAAEPVTGRVTLVSDPRYGRATVNLTSVRESDGGWYECRVYFPNRSPGSRPNGTWFHLTVDGGTLLATPPLNQTTLEGQDAHFPCETKDTDAAVTWYKDGVPLDESLQERAEVDDHGSLTLHDTHMDDLGRYDCVVTNSRGERQTAGAYLDVQFKAKVVHAPKEVSLPHGRPAVLECHFRANPPLTNLRWEKDDFLFDPYNVHGVFYSKNGSLYFSKVDETHAGRYSCTPINALGTEGPSPPMLVVVRKAPMLTVAPLPLYLRSTGDAVEMPCDAMDGDDQRRPAIVWIKTDGTLPKERMTLHNGTLTISDLRASDAGRYQCVVTNEAATAVADTELVVGARGPANLSAMASSSVVTLRWAPGGDYSVWFRPADDPSWQSVSVDRNATQLSVGGLGPGKDYDFLVLSQDRSGDGGSRVLRVRTTGGADQNSSAQEFRSPLGTSLVIGPPRNLTVALTDGGYLVTWQPPEWGHSDLGRYLVKWAREDGGEGRAETTDTTYLVSRLEEGVLYHVAVSAVSTSGHEAAAAPFPLHVPSSTSALGLGIAAGVAFLLVAVVGGWYIRRVLVRRTQSKSGSY